MPPDNTILPPGGGGDTIATDDVGGVKHQRILVEYGPDGAPIQVNTGASALPIQDGGNSITVDGTVSVAGTVPVSDAGGSLTVDTPQLPAALVSGRLDVNIGAGSVTISGTPTVDTELPAAAALADGAANPTTPTVGAAVLAFNGATNDRMRGDVANGLDVDVTRSALPTGAATSANQTTEITALQIIDNLAHGMNAAFNNACPAAGQLDDAATTAATEDNIAPVRITAQRGMHVNLRNNAGTELGTAGAPVRTDPTGSTTQPVSGTVTADTELPAAAALADATANPTVPGVGAFINGYNGATWDRLRSSTANGLVVDVSRVQGTVTCDTELPAAAALADTTANPTTPLIGAANEAFNGATWDRVRIGNGTAANAAMRVTIASDSTGTVDTELPAAAALADGAANPTTPTVGAAALVYNGATFDRLRVVAHDAVGTSVNPILTGGYASVVAPTQVSADGDATRQWVDRRGAMVARVAPIDFGALGAYSIAVNNGTTAMAAGLAANSPIVSFRWAQATNICLIKRVRLTVVGTATGFAVGLGQFDLLMVRSFTAADTGGGTLTLTTNNAKRRTTMGTTGVAEIRRSTTATLTAGTRTSDAQPHKTRLIAFDATANKIWADEVPLFDAQNGEYPLALAQNEGIVIQATVPATGTWFYSITIDWEEVAAY